MWVGRSLVAPCIWYGEQTFSCARELFCVSPACLWRLDAAAGEGLPAARSGAVKRRCADIIVLCAPYIQSVYPSEWVSVCVCIQEGLWLLLAPRAENSSPRLPFWVFYYYIGGKKITHPSIHAFALNASRVQGAPHQQQICFCRLLAGGQLLLHRVSHSFARSLCHAVNWEPVCHLPL